MPAWLNGAFVPMPNGEKLNIMEKSEVEITVHNPYVLPSSATSDEERERALYELMESWQQHPLTEEAQRLTRDGLHERR